MSAGLKSFFRWVIKIAVGILLYIVVNQYFFCPQYNFPTPHPFSGSFIYNPYQNMDSLQWRKCNFHAHTRAWYGATTGEGNEEKLWNTYDSLGYDVHCISNYERVNRYHDTAHNYLAAYEHGYGLMKNHHLLLNTRQVIWGDYYFPQTLSNKQHMLECLHADDTQLLCINHPLLSHGYAPDNMRYLRGYDCLEVLRENNTYSFLNWDAALESGNPVFILADDDVHHIDNPFEVGRNCTWVNSSTIRANDIILALKTGNAYGMIVGYTPDETMQQKLAKVKAGLPMLRDVHLNGDTINVRVSKKAQEINFFGENLQQIGMILSASEGMYVMKKTDPYVRVQIKFDDGTQMFLNPFFRYDGNFPEQKIPPVNELKTILLRIGGVLILLSYLIILIVRGRRKHSLI